MVLKKKHTTLIALLLGLILFSPRNTKAKIDTVSYEITLREEIVVKAKGKEVMGMTVNGSIPGPTLRFKEGQYAVIYVKNEMDVETSVHWHGLLLPNFYDGVPYLTTPPIEPGKTQKYEFPLIQSGTYWYHSHTMLQEQSGVYGSFVIDPKKETLTYDKELVMVLSDWTNQKPLNVLRNLKRGNEWYNIKKGTATPLNQVIARGALGAQLNFWRQRMEGADIADIYYPAFLVNGQQKQEYSQFKAGERVRLRIINGSASTQYWMTFGGEDPLLVSSDGLNVVPVRRDKIFIGIAETYDFIITIPREGKIEFRATAQDGSGHASAFLGSGKVISAPTIPRPDKIGMMKRMAKMDMRMGAPAMKFKPGEVKPKELMENWGMQMDGEMQMKDSEHDNMPGMDMANSRSSDESAGMNMYSEYSYDYLKSPSSTAIVEDKPVRNILLNLTGNMWRYIWSMNGVPLAEADMIKISKGEKVRITFNNLTMMHHPMHLHGHFFRVINKHGDYSPLKHTVNIPPMNKTTIEFDATEYGDWFLHCHVLYHMIGGMARAVSYDTERDPRMKDHPREILFREGNHYYSWGMADIASHMTEVNLVSSNIRNQFNLDAEVGYNENMEAELTYERYLYDYFRLFAGLNVENEIENSLDELSVTAIAGIRFFTPYMFDLDVRIDNKLRPEIRLSRELMVFPLTVIFGNCEYQADFGWVNKLTEEGTDEPVDYKQEITWSAGLEYFLSRNFSLMGSYDNRFGAGGGLSIRF